MMQNVQNGKTRAQPNGKAASQPSGNGEQKSKSEPGESRNQILKMKQTLKHSIRQLKHQKQHQQSSQPQHHNGTGKVSNNKQQQQQSPSDDTKPKVSKKKGKLDASPDTIVRNILDQTKFKTPNLSQIVEEKFNAPDYKAVVEAVSKSIEHEDTVSCLPEEISVLPLQMGFEKITINPSPFAITSLRCVNDPNLMLFDRWRNKMKGGPRKENINRTTKKDKANLA